MRRIKYVVVLLATLLLSFGLFSLRALADEEPMSEDGTPIDQQLFDASDGSDESSLAAKVVSLDAIAAGKKYVLLADHTQCKRVFSVQPEMGNAIAYTSEVHEGTELALPSDTVTWTIEKGEDGAYTISSGSTYLSLDDGQVFADAAAALTVTAKDGGFTIANGSDYLAVDYSKGHVIVPVETSKASVIYVAEVVEEEPEPEPEPLDTDVQIPALLPSEDFTAIITDPSKLYSSNEYVIFTKNADGAYVAIDREGTASAPLSVDELAYGNQITSPDNDVTWLISSYDNLENKTLKYITSVANGLHLTAHAAKGVLTDDAALSDFRVIYGEGDLSAQLKTDAGVYLALGADGFYATTNAEEAAELYFAIVHTEEQDLSTITEGYVMKIVDWDDVAKDGSKEYAIVNAAEFNYQHHALNGLGRFPESAVSILSQDICPDYYPTMIDGVPIAQSYCAVVEDDVVYANNDKIFWTVTSVDGGVQFKNTSTGVYLEVGENNGPLQTQDVSADDGAKVVVEEVDDAPVIYIGNGNGSYMTIYSYLAVTDNREKNAADTFFLAEVIEDEADYPAETLPAGGEDTLYYGGIYSVNQTSAHTITDGTMVNSYVLMKPGDTESTFKPSENDYQVGFCVDAQGEIWGSMDPLAEYKAIAPADYEYLDDNGKLAVATMVIHAYPNMPIDCILDMARASGYELSEDCGADELLAGLQCAIYTYTDPREDGSEWGYSDTSMGLHAQFEIDKAGSIVGDPETAKSDVNNIRDFYLGLAQKAIDGVDKSPADNASSTNKAGLTEAADLLFGADDGDVSNGEDAEENDYKLTSLNVTTESAGDGMVNATITGTLNKPVEQSVGTLQAGMFYSGADIYVLVQGGSGHERVYLNPGDTSFEITLEGLSENDELMVVVDYVVRNGMLEWLSSGQYQRLVIVDGTYKHYADVASTLNLPVEKQWVHEEDLTHDPVTVELLDNGNATGKEVELSADNNWSDSFPMILSSVKRYNYTYVGSNPIGTAEVEDTPTIAHEYTFTEKNGSGKYILETVPSTLVKMASSPTAAGEYIFYITNGDFAGCVDVGRDAPIKCSLEDLTSLPKGYVSQYLSEEDIAVFDNWYKIEADGTAYYVDRAGNYYTVVQSAWGCDYVMASSKDEATVLNIYQISPYVIKNIPVTSATVKKVWDDDDNKAGTRPDSVTVTLSDGTEVELNEENGWKATIDKLPKYDDDGEEIEYSWTEESVSGYELTSTDVDDDVTTLTNTVISSKDEPEESTDTPSKKTSKKATKKHTVIPQTGDEASTLPFALVGAALVCSAAGVAMRKRQS